MTNEVSKIEVKNSVIASSNVSSNVVDEIKKLDIITLSDIQRLENAGSFILANFRDIPSYRPLIVKITSVLNDSNFPTPDMKYWQCGKEAEVHFNELTRDYFKYQRSIVDIEEMTHKINEMDKMLTGVVSLPPESKYDPVLIQFDKKRLEIQRSQYEFELKLLEKDIKYRIQEVIEWNDISKKLEGDCKYSLVNYAEHYDAEGHIAWLQERLKDPKTDDKGKANYRANWTLLYVYQENLLNERDEAVLCYYGGKWRATKTLYPPPQYKTIIEPFSGAAGYSVRYYDRSCILYEINPIIAGIWDYLIKASSEEIMKLPIVVEDVDILPISQEEKHLIGFWLNKGAASPCKKPSKWMRSGINPTSQWGKEIRERIASQVPLIKHWQVINKSYEDIENSVAATWFIDPPYNNKAGSHYIFSDINYDRLGEWCKSREGQVIVCENDGASWLPFIPLASIHSASGKSKEVVWIKEGTNENEWWK